MRLWTLHPKYLDPKGLVALWREALLAKAVLRGETKGYRHHPQLTRFQAHPEPLAAINTYLSIVFAESIARGYSFDGRKVATVDVCAPIIVTSGQLAYEWEHLLSKVETRSPDWFRRWRGLKVPEAHPLFSVVAGPVAPWEHPKPSQ